MKAASRILHVAGIYNGPEPGHGPDVLVMVMRFVCLCGVVMTLATAPEARDRQRGPARTFDSEAVGAAPTGFTLAAMRQASPGTWAVRKHGTSTHLVHDADAAAAGVSLAHPLERLDE